MKCKDCDCVRKGWFESKPDAYVCIGVKEPFVISDINSECTEYEDKRNKKEIHLVVEAEECPYWNYDNQTYSHTCGSCDCLREGNNIDNVHFGVMIDGNRYCIIGCDVYGEILKSLKKEEQINKYRKRFNEIFDDIENDIMRR